MDLVTMAMAQAIAKNYTDAQLADLGFTNLSYHFCTSGEYNATSKQPTISGSDANTFYFTPGSTNELFNVYYNKGSGWTKFTTVSVDLSVIPTDDTLSKSGFAADSKTVGDEISHLRDDLNVSSLIYEPEETPGYIGAQGGISAPTANKEVYTAEIPVKLYDSLGLHLNYTTARNMWMAYALYDSNHTFISRTVIVNTADTQVYSDTLSIINANAAYVAFTYRTYGEAKLTIYNNFLAKLTPLSGSIGSDTDLNGLQKPGFYITKYNNFPTNYPEDVTKGQGLVFVYPDNTKARPFLVQEFINVYTGIAYYRVKAASASATWGAWIAKKWYTSLGMINSGNDLNALKAEGYYLTQYNSNPANAPTGMTQGLVLVTVSDVNAANPFVAQTFINLLDGKLYVRSLDASASATWGTWRTQNISAITTLGSLTSADDLDSKQSEGYYITGYSSIPVNAPDGATQGLVVVTVDNNASAHPFVVQTYLEVYTGKLYMRVKAGSSSAEWGIWRTQEQEATSSNWNESKTSTSFNNYEEENTSIIPVSGDRVRVMAYNVAHYTNDTSTYIDVLHNKMTNFKKLLMFVNADIIATPEDDEYIDSGDAKDSTTWLYKPIYPFKVGAGSCCLHSKVQYTSSRNITLPGGWTIRKGVIPVGNKSLTVYSVHLTVTSEESRATELAQIFDQIETDNPEYYVIAGDMNTFESGEPETFKATCESHGCKLANGGYLGWLNTHKTNLAIDNIVVSGNIIIENTMVLGNWFEDLYSDHYPMFCDLVLI